MSALFLPADIHPDEDYVRFVPQQK